MVSREQAGFVVPMIINAYIANRTDAIKYLSAFRPINTEQTDWSRLTPKEWGSPEKGSPAKEEAQPLETALNNVVFSKVLEQLAQLFVQTPILAAEAASKIYIPAVFEGMTAAEVTRRVNEVNSTGTPINITRDVMSIRDWARETYGITTTTMAFGDGIIFDNSDIQHQIDALAVGVMRERALAQDQQNAMAEQRVKMTEAETARRVAETQASSASARRILQQIENEKMIAEATARAIEAGRVVPAGSYPLGLTSLIVTPNYNALGQR
jgi:hypothetical protein